MPEQPKLPRPTDSELEILTVLWRLGPSTVRDVHEALGKDSAYTTTLKQMQVMTEKGLLLRTEKYRTHVYQAGTPKEQTQSAIMGDLIRRAFEGSAKNLVLGALTSQPSTPEDLDEIRRMLDAHSKPQRRQK